MATTVATIAAGAAIVLQLLLRSVIDD